MNLSASDLPDDVDALKAMIVAMSAQGAAARAEIARLETLKKDTDERIANLTYRFEDSRGGRCVARHLSGFNGILQVDGHGAYTSMVKEQVKAGSNETITLAGCWAHVRRKFYELHIGGINHAATASVKAMTELWSVEDDIRGKDANIRAAGRQERSAAIVASLFALWEKEVAKVSGKSKTAEAIRYAMTRRQFLERFLTDSRIEIDSNIVARAIRPQTITRKNSQFAGSEGGGNTWPITAVRLAGP